MSAVGASYVNPACCGLGENVARLRRLGMTSDLLMGSACCLADKDRSFAWSAFAGEGVGGAAGWNGDALSPGRRVNGSRRRAATDRSGERAKLAGGEGA